VQGALKRYLTNVGAATTQLEALSLSGEPERHPAIP
jgi:hypothetical protein